MKQVLFIILGMTSLEAFAKQQAIKLHYHFRDTHLEVPVRAPSEIAAIEPGADKCFEFYTKHFKLSRSEKEDLVDICANPRKK